MSTESGYEDIVWHKFTQYLHQDVLDGAPDLEEALRSALISLSTNERRILKKAFDELLLQSEDNQWAKWRQSSSSISPTRKDIGRFILLLHESLERLQRTGK